MDYGRARGQLDVTVVLSVRASPPWSPAHCSILSLIVRSHRRASITWYSLDHCRAIHVHQEKKVPHCPRVIITSLCITCSKDVHYRRLFYSISSSLRNHNCATLSSPL